jgi:type IV fimbrial biogenesis protein FimT
MHTTPGTATMTPLTLRRAPRCHQTGFSLVEALMPMAVAAVLLGSALPSLETMKLRRQLEGSAAQLETDLQLARATAVAANEVLRMDFVAGAAGSCYVLHDGAAGDCTCAQDGVPSCVAGASVLRSQHFATGHPIQLNANANSIAFDPVKGTITPTATMRLQSPRGSLRVVINVMGRVRSCTPDNAVPGHRHC